MMNIIELAEEFDRLDKELEFRAKIDEFNQRQRDMIDMLPKDIKRNIEILKTNDILDILLLELAEEFDRLDKEPEFRAKIDEFNQRQRNIEILKTNDILLLELAEEFDRLDKDPKFSTQSAQLRRDGFRLDIFFKD